jgi:hypothetical protein
MGAAKARHEAKCGQPKDPDGQQGDAAKKQRVPRSDSGWNKFFKCVNFVICGCIVQ